MAKNNYQAWHVSAAEFSDDWDDLEKLSFFGRYAVLAPSGHNTQPWQFKVKGDILVLSHNTKVRLAHSGKLAAEPYVSLGSCLQTFLLAGKAFGYEVAMQPLDGSYTKFALKLGKKTKPEPALANAISSRVSNRKFYDDKPLAPDVIHAITSASLPHASLKIISDKPSITFLAEQTSVATKKIMSDAEFRKELSHWVRNNLTKQHDGMPGFVQEMPTPPSLVARQVIAYFDVSGTQAKKDASRVLHSPAIIVLMAQQKSPESFLNIGRLYALTCVTAQLHGYATSGVGAAAIDLDSKQLVKKELGLSHEPTAMIRIGKTSQKVRHTPRYMFEQVLR